MRNEVKVCGRFELTDRAAGKTMLPRGKKPTECIIVFVEVPFHHAHSDWKPWEANCSPKPILIHSPHGGRGNIVGGPLGVGRLAVYTQCVLRAHLRSVDSQGKCETL